VWSTNWNWPADQVGLLKVGGIAARLGKPGNMRKTAKTIVIGRRSGQLRTLMAGSS
jgi:hypothetical protein